MYVCACISLHMAWLSLVKRPTKLTRCSDFYDSMPETEPGRWECEIITFGKIMSLGCN